MQLDCLTSRQKKLTTMQELKQFCLHVTYIFRHLFWLYNHKVDKFKFTFYIRTDMAYCLSDFFCIKNMRGMERTVFYNDDDINVQLTISILCKIGDGLLTKFFFNFIKIRWLVFKKLLSSI